MTQPPDDFNPTPGEAVTLEPGLRRILAPNPSPMTYRGTNTYLVGSRGLAVIDPGPQDATHLKAILAAVEPGQDITHIVVSHAHLDHSPLASSLSECTGAPVFAYGKAHAGRSKVMTQLAADGLAGGGEGIDEQFTPDRTVSDGETIAGNGWALQVIHTPGHIGNHIALGWNDVCFTADHVMGWASSLVSPPDGDLTDFMASCARLAERNWRVFYPGHGAPVAEPSDRLGWLVNHRKGREASILQALGSGPLNARDLARQIYTDISIALLPAAERNVFAHLVDLTGQFRVAPQGALSSDACFELVN